MTRCDGCVYVWGGWGGEPQSSPLKLGYLNMLPPQMYLNYSYATMNIIKSVRLMEIGKTNLKSACFKTNV